MFTSDPKALAEALVFGNLMAVVMVLLFGFRLLPGLQRIPGDSNLIFSVWALSCGFLVVVLVMLLWQPRRAVFLDRICISEDDTELKTLAIFSNAAAKALFFF